MKNLIISNSLWNIYNFRYKFIIELSKIGPVVIYCDFKKKSQINDKKLPKNVTIKNLNFSSKTKNLFKNIKLLFQFFQILKKEDPTNLFTFTLKPNLYCGIVNNFSSFSFFPTVSGLGTAKNRGGILFFFVKILMKFSFKNSKTIFVHNKYEKFFLKKIGLNSNKIVQINGSGINLQKFNHLKYRKNICDNYLFVGRLISDKGIYELISAFKTFSKLIKKKIHLTLAVLVDEDNETSININYLKKELSGSNITIMKNVKNIRNLLKSHGCLILPTYSEGMSRSIMEAISSARPVICSNISGCKEMVINNFNGFLIEPKSINSIYLALKKFNKLTFKDKIRFGRNSRYLAKKNRFDEKYVVSHYLNQIKNDEIYK